MNKKILSVLLAVMMIITTASTVPMFAFADIDNFNGDDEGVVSTNIDNFDGEDEEIQEEIDGMENLIAKFDAATVNADDSQKIESIKKDAQTYLNNLADVLASDQKTQLEGIISDAEALQKTISNADKAVKDACAAADANMNVTASNLDAAKKAVAGIDSVLTSGNLTDSQRTELNNKKAALQKAIDDYSKNVPSTPSEPAKPSVPTQPQTPTQPSKPAETLNVGDVSNNKNAIALNSKLAVSNSGKKLQIKWGKVAEADGYLVYAQYCGKKLSKKATKTIKKAKTTSLSITKLNGKALNTKKNFKVYVAAYKNVNGKKVVIAKSIVAHIAGAKSKKYTNVKKVTVSKSSYNLKKGATASIKAKVTLNNSKKKQLSNKHTKKFRYKTTNKKVATVTASGKIKAVGKGKCKVYVYARNGRSKAVTVVVK